MKKQHFDISIQAPKEKVWEILWNDKSYNTWTAVFSESSHAKSDWKEGSKIYFLDGKGSGMYSVIEKKVPPTEMTFKHLGEVKDGKEIESSWAGAEESYYLNSKDGMTELRVEVDINEEMGDFFTKTFPKALQIVKQLSEEE